MSDKRCTTLRQLFEMVQADDPAFLDVPLSFNIISATNLYKNEHVALNHDLWGLPRTKPIAHTGEAGSISIRLNLHNHSLKQVKK